MSKELEQAINHLEEELKNKQDWSCVACKEEHEQLLEWLKELQVIKNSKPSEALEYLEYIGETCYVEAGNAEEDCTLYAKNYIGYDTIKNYILKAQEQEKENSRVVGGRTFDKEILYLKQSIEQCNDKPIFYVSRIYGNKYIVPQKQLDDLTNENVRYKRVLEIIKEKYVDIWLLRSCLTVEQYNFGITQMDNCSVFNLTQEEFDTLKEILG